MEKARERARSSVGFDWLMAALAFLMICGPLIDGWAHSHGEVDQSFLTPWHAVLYGAMAINGLVLLAAGIVGLRRGYSFRNALPPGYWVSALGVVLFVVGGGFDAWWHTMFGIESGVLALLISPSHLVLAVAGGMITSGPLLSIAAQYGRDASGWKTIGPAIVSAWAILVNLGFFLAYAQPIEDGFTPLTMRPAGDDAVYPSLYRLARNGSLTRLPVPAKLDLETVDASPDGKHLVYRVNRYQDPDALPPSDIEVAGADGAHPVAITNSGRHDTEPVWSPDGKWIAYVSMPAESSGDFRIRIISPDGKTSRDLLVQTTTLAQLSWSPDGRSIAYGSRNGATAMIAVVDVATGKTHWLPATANGNAPVWTRRGIVYAGSDGSIRIASPDGASSKTIVEKSDGSPAISRDARSMAFLNTELGSEQVWVSDLGGSKPRDVSQLSGMDVQDAAWAPDGSLLFVALGRRDPTRTGIGKALAMTAMILEAVILAGAMLALLRRFRVPFGAFTLMFAGFSLAMALQSDFYAYAIGGAIAGFIADLAVAILGERARSGLAFYVLGALVPLLFTLFFEIVTARINGGEGWAFNLSSGAPLLAAAAGLFVAFCFESPLGSGAAASYPDVP
ncbi:MAG: PD40 domain-containing protein [Candidatus Eremiobacteraeota bacterium]|nr:PD40 domain-containing protein [Candidatus Eremiobacteraeota bacterium]